MARKQKFEVRDGDELDSKNFQTFSSHCYNSALYFIENYGYNSAKIRDRLTRVKHVPQTVYVDGEPHNIIEETIECLKNDGLLDDNNALMSAVSAYITSGNYSVKKIVATLVYNKKFDKDKVEKAVYSALEDVGLDPFDYEYDIAAPIVRHLLNSDKLHSQTYMQVRQTILVKLSRKMFNFAVIDTVLYDFDADLKAICGENNER